MLTRIIRLFAVAVICALPVAAQIPFVNVAYPSSGTPNTRAVPDGFNLLGSGAINITAGGSNKSITLTPSGTGKIQGSPNTNSAVTHGIVNAGVGVTEWQVANGNVAFKMGVSSTLGYIDSAASGAPITFRIGGVEKARFAPTTGNLLLGGLTTDATGHGPLQLPTGASDITSGITFRSGALDLYARSNQILQLLATSGTAQFEVADAANTARLTSSTVAGTAAFTARSDNGTLTLFAGGANSIIAQTNSVTALTIDSSQKGIWAATYRSKNYTVATLPAGPSAGDRAHVTDSTATLTAGIGAVVAGGGSNVVPVFYDGTNWRIY